MDTSSPSSVSKAIGNDNLNLSRSSFTQLESVDYQQLNSDKAQLMSQNIHPVPAYVPSGQLVSMSGFIENGQFVPVQLNTIPRSISNNSMSQSQAQHYSMDQNQNQLHSSPTVAFQSVPPLYQHGTYLQELPISLVANAPSSMPGGMKRGHHDVSASTDNGRSAQEEEWRIARGIKEINRNTDQSNINTAANQHTTAPGNFHSEINVNQNSYAQPSNVVASGSAQVTSQAQRYAATRYPFSPFVIHFKDEARDTLVIEHLVKHSKEQLDFVLEIMGYRRSQVNCTQGEYDILVFVETTNSFEFLLDDAHWPSQLVGKNFTVKKPSIPPQLSAVIQNVALGIDWKDFTADLQSNYPDIVKVVRLKSRHLQDLKLVKIEIKSVKTRNEILEQKLIGIANIRYKVVEYFALANVLICSRCMGIGHFQKNCPQKDYVTCKICGEKCHDIKDHKYSGEPKCIHCGEAHRSNDSKCRVVKDYRAALTRTLLNKPVNHQMNNIMNPSVSSLPLRQPILTHPVGQNSLDTDKILKKMEEEGEKTRSSLELFKTEMLERISENKLNIALLKEQLEANEKKTREIQATMDSWVENSAVREQTVQYVLNKAETTDSVCDSVRLEMKAVLSNVDNLMRLFVALRENRGLSVPDDYYSLFVDKIRKFDSTVRSPLVQKTVTEPAR